MARCRNTACWSARPVSLLPRDPLAGFKAGALNFALRETVPGTDIVAAITTSDYVVAKS